MRNVTDDESSQQKEPELIRFQNELIEKRSEFQKQFEQAKKQFPLVAIGMEIQKANIKDMLSNIYISELDTIQFYEDLFGDNLLDDHVKVETQQRIQKLKRCLGRSETYSDGLSCFEEYNER